jgi:hypothetical protein
MIGNGPLLRSGELLGEALFALRGCRGRAGGGQQSNLEIRTLPGKIGGPSAFAKVESLGSSRRFAEAKVESQQGRVVESREPDLRNPHLASPYKAREREIREPSANLS